MSLLNQPQETPSMGHKGLHEFSSMLPLLCLQGQGSVHLVRILEFLNTILMKFFYEEYIQTPSDIRSFFFEYSS